MWGLEKAPLGKAECSWEDRVLGTSWVITEGGGRGTAIAYFPLALNFQKVSSRLLQVRRVPRGLSPAVRHPWRRARAMLPISSSVPRDCDHRETGGLLGALQQDQQQVWGFVRLRPAGQGLPCASRATPLGPHDPRSPRGGQPPLVSVKAMMGWGWAWAASHFCFLLQEMEEAALEPGTVQCRAQQRVLPTAGRLMLTSSCTLVCIALVLYSPEHIRTIEIGNPAVSQDLCTWPAACGASCPHGMTSVSCL